MLPVAINYLRVATINTIVINQRIMVCIAKNNATIVICMIIHMQLLVIVGYFLKVSTETHSKKENKSDQ